MPPILPDFFALEKIYFYRYTSFMSICNGFIIVILNKLINKYFYISFFSNTVNIEKYSPRKQMLFESLIIFERVKVPETKKFESYQPR